ncbi:hypothetical protein LPB72_14930 [Hydrogenophaga crassostreae]|uniref:HDOD domain-containing protein n=1 Tax=Hydrogenophaga crassostreae TaxID=1763535 RepID=A0A167HH87_9BURK|nr:HDOD domain-containing protein [Hydrogenophaga crassostreae]AOW12252.1 hypothetical protein LPB072_04680 [Hydrogenophaga crassostreae]OAD41198.1 hypothetical protein LPB72_14930 [Hydrogenophaga crassostreae]
MSDTILDSVALAYQPIWNRDRCLAAVRVGVLAVQPDAVDGAHLLQAIGEDWPAAAPLLSLSFSSTQLRDEALASAPVDNTWIEVPSAPFIAPAGLERLTLAVRRGHHLLRQAPLASVRNEQIAPLGVRSLLRPSPEEALEAMRCHGAGEGAENTPLLPGQIYEGIAGRGLAAICLDDAGAFGLAGWPDDDVLHSWRGRQLIGARSVIEECRQAIESDCSIDQLERYVRQDPVLVYRLLILVNSPAVGTAREIETLRHAIMMLGFGALKQWLGEQLAGSETDIELHPVRFAQVMRARLAQHMLDSGSEEELRAEVYLTALFAQLDQLMQQPLGPLLHKLPLTGRLLDALLRKAGPYVSLLEVARAQGDFDHLHMLPAVCHAHDITLEHANRSLLRMLASSRDQTHPPRDHPWAMDRD